MLSVIIPLLDCNLIFLRCVLSFASIFDKDEVELVVVCPEKNVKIVSDYLANINLSIAHHVMPESSAGIYVAMNDGIRYSRGEYLTFFGQDDFIFPCYREFVEKIRHCRKDVKVFSCNIVMGGTDVEVSKYRKFKFFTGNYCHQALIYRKDVFQTEIFEPKYKIMADKVLNMSVIQRNNFLHFPKICAYFSTDGASSVEFDKVFHQDFPKLLSEKSSWILKLLIRFAVLMKGLR